MAETLKKIKEIIDKNREKEVKEKPESEPETPQIITKGEPYYIMKEDPLKAKKRSKTLDFV